MENRTDTRGVRAPASLEAWRAAGRTVEVLGHRLFLVDSAPEDADRTPVLLIHGFPTAGWDWHALWDTLAERYRLLAPDLLGFGFSEKPRGHDYTIHEQADLLEALTSRLGLRTFHVLAHDYGDSVAQELLHRQNQLGQRRQWLSASFLNGGLFPESHRPRLAQKLLLGPLGGLLARALGRGTLDRNMRAIFGARTQPDRATLDEFWTLVTHAGGKANFHRLIRYLRDRRQHRERWLAALRDAAVPLQIINGSVDPVSGAHMVARYRELVGHGEIIELREIGHYPQLEAPQAVARHWLAFAARHRDPGAGGASER